MSRFLILATILLFAVAGTACSSGTNAKSQAGQDTSTNTGVIVKRDADVSEADAPADPDAATAVVRSPDATGADLWCDPSSLLPDCVGTPEQVSNCIINLPTRNGTPVTRPDPMDYSLCRP